jgi:hypothetical protein
MHTPSTDYAHMICLNILKLESRILLHLVLLQCWSTTGCLWVSMVALARMMLKGSNVGFFA